MRTGSLGHTPFKLDTISAATVQGLANNLQYAQYKGKDKGQELHVLPEETEDAEEEILSRAQLEAFPEEYIALLCSWLDDQGVLRCDGRLQFAECSPYDVRFTIKLPRGQWRTGLVVKHYNELSNHSAGTNFVLSQISGRFWIVTAYEEIRAWEDKCSEQNRSRNKPAKDNGDITTSKARFTFRLFDQTEADYAGVNATM